MDLTEIIDLFVSIEPAERLEVLIDFGTQLDALPPEYAALRDSGQHIVHECQAPVFFYARIAGDTLKIEVDVPREAAIARGFVGLLKRAFNDKPVPALSEVPENLLQALRIDTALGLQRRKGLSAIYQALLDRLPEA